MAKVVFSSYRLIIPDFFSKIIKLGKYGSPASLDHKRPKKRHPIVKQKLIRNLVKNNLSIWVKIFK